MAGDEVHALGLCGIRALEDGVDIGKFGGLRDARAAIGGGRLDEDIRLDFETSSAIFRIGFELRANPLLRQVDAGALRHLLHAGKRVAGFEADELLDGLVNAFRRNGTQRRADFRIGGRGLEWSANGFEVDLLRHGASGG